MSSDDEHINKRFFQERIENIREHSPYISMQEIQKRITPIHFREFLEPDQDYDYDYDISLDMSEFFLTPQEYQTVKNTIREEIPSYILVNFFYTLAR